MGLHTQKGALCLEINAVQHHLEILSNLPLNKRSPTGHWSIYQGLDIFVPIPASAPSQPLTPSPLLPSAPVLLSLPPDHCHPPSQWWPQCVCSGSQGLVWILPESQSRTLGAGGGLTTLKELACARRVQH